MSAAPRFSIVVPVHDDQPWLGETIDSVRRQSRDDWELIVVDDGARDESIAVARELAEPRVRVLRAAHGGVLAARRSGLRAAAGSAIVFLDADDRLRRDALARFAAALDEAPDALVVYGDRVLADRDGRVFGSEHGALLAPRPSGDVLERLLARNFLSTPGQACIRTAALRDADEWRTELRRMGDWYVWCRLACRGPFAYIGRGPVLEYRLHASSMSRHFTTQDDEPPSIAELVPSIDAVFALPEVARRLPETRRARLRRRSEASAWAWKAQELLRAGRLRASRRYLLEALRRDPLQPVDLLCLALTLLGSVPAPARRWVGSFEPPPAPPRDAAGARRAGMDPGAHVE